jgi:hypothetical protein
LNHVAGSLATCDIGFGNCDSNAHGTEIIKIVGWLSNMILQKLILIHDRWVLLKKLLRV